MGKKKLLAGGSVGCLGCGGLAAAGSVVAIALLGAGLWVVQDQWQASARWLLEERTGGEVRFSHLRVGWGRLALHGLEVDDARGDPLLRASKAVLHVDPWSLDDPDRIELDGVRLVDVALTPRWDDGWGLPPTTTALLQGTGGFDLPEVYTPSVEIEGLTVTLGDLEVVVEAARADGLTLRASDGSAELGALQAEGVGLGSSLHIASLKATPVGATSLDMEELRLADVAVAGVRGTAGPSGWTAVDQGLSALDGATFPTVHAGPVSIDDVRLQAEGAQVVAASARTSEVRLAAGPTASWEPVSIGPTEVEVGGSARARVKSLAVPAGRLGASDTQLALGTVTATDGWALAAWGEDAFGIPTDLFRLGGVRKGVRVAQLDVQGVALRVEAPSGALDVTASSAALRDIGVQPGTWSVGSGTLSQVEAKEGDKRKATARSLALERSGTVRVDRGEVWTRFTKDQVLALPPVASDHTPGWMGGSWGGDGSYYGVSFPGSPWAPKKLYAPDLMVHLVDAGIARPPAEWDIPMELTLGPIRADGNTALKSVGTFAGGTFTSRGHIEPSGRIVMDLVAGKMKLKELDPYLGAPLEALKLKVRKGKAGADVKVTLTGSVVRVKGTGSAKNVELGGNALADAANFGFDLLSGGDKTIEIPLDVKGDLADPGFSIVRAVMESYAKGLAGDLGNLDTKGGSKGGKAKGGKAKKKTKKKPAPKHPSQR